MCVVPILPMSSSKHHYMTCPAFVFLLFQPISYLKTFYALCHGFVILWIFLEHGHISCKYAYQVLHPTFILSLSLYKLMPNPQPPINFGILHQSPSFFYTSDSKTPFPSDCENSRGHFKWLSKAGKKEFIEEEINAQAAIRRPDPR